MSLTKWDNTESTYCNIKHYRTTYSHPDDVHAVVFNLYGQPRCDLEMKSDINDLHCKFASKSV